MNPIRTFEDNPLIPFHFLTHKGMSVNSTNATEAVNSPLKKKWPKILKIQQHIWKRFQKEYLHQLKKKAKWINKDRELQKGEPAGNLIIESIENLVPLNIIEAAE